MNATYLVTSYLVTDDVFKAMHYQDDNRTRINSGEILTVVVAAAKCFQTILTSPGVACSRFITALVQHYRLRIETVNSQLMKMGLQRLHMITNSSFSLKVLASLLTTLSAIFSSNQGYK